MAKDKKKAVNGPAKTRVVKRDVKTQTTRDFCMQISRAELKTELAEIEDLKMTGRVMEYNGYKIRKPKPMTRDAMTMTSRDVSTQVYKDTLIAVRREVKIRGQSEQGPLIVAFKPRKRLPKYVRPRPPQKSIMIQTSRDFGGQVSAQEIRESFTEDMAGGENGYVVQMNTLPSSAKMEEAVTSETHVETLSETTVTTTTVTVTTQEDVTDEWKLEIVDDAGMNAVIVNCDDDKENLIENSETNIVTTTTTISSGIDNPVYDAPEQTEEIEINNITNGIDSLAADDDDSEEEFSTFL